MPDTKPNTLDNVRIKYVTADFSEGMTTIKDFIKLNPESLDSTSRELLSVVRCLYELNDCEPPLYKSFPDRPDRPLTIDGTDLLKWSVVPKKGEELAFFRPKENIITFNDKETGITLFNALTHELKHAEQYSVEVEELSQSDGLAHHQLGYLQEAQAYAFWEYVAVLCFLKKGWTFDQLSEKYPGLKEVFKKTLKDGKLDRTTFEQERMRAYLTQLFKSSYRDEYHKRKSIKEDDKGISHIPESFNLKDEAFKEEVLKQLENVPRKAVEPASRLLQLLSDGHEIKTALFMLLKFKDRKEISNLAFNVLMERACRDDIKQEEFKSLLQMLSEWGATTQKNGKTRGGALKAAAVNKTVFSVLFKEGYFGKNDVKKVAEIAAREGSVEMIESAVKDEKTPLNEEETKELLAFLKPPFKSTIRPRRLSSQKKMAPKDLRSEKTKG